MSVAAGGGGRPRCPDDLHPARLRELLSAGKLGCSVIFLERVASTNSATAAIAAAGAPEGTVVIAGTQYAGRGRNGRSWFSTPGRSLVFSVILRPGEGRESLTALMALAAATAVERSCPRVKGCIKWPNDIYIDDRKAGGILAESRGENVIIGTGLNINEEEADFPPELTSAISLKGASGKDLDRGEFLALLLELFGDMYSRWENEGLEVFRYDIAARLLWKGRRVRIECGEGRFFGFLSGITGEGYLKLDIGGSEKIFQAGDLSVEEEVQ